MRRLGFPSVSEEEVLAAVVDSDRRHTIRELARETGEILFLYKIAPFWLSFLGIFSTIFIALSLVLITGWNKNLIPADSKCLSQVTRYWFKQKECSNMSSRKEGQIKVIEDEDRI
ncbi:hypothetical protein AVEN_93090-1 [Araneus ventricosus]|uniref:Uncharacterized protein n=1 Tax=Araneus ventricosus TaxID=182803 RepID=A0A4Y2TGF9_ARAVE|nr:hypothetical protein AVEN_93090-1 [Araneus ventricosus]